VKVELRSYKISFSKNSFEYFDSVFNTSVKLNKCSNRIIKNFKNRFLKSAKNGIKTKKEQNSPYYISFEKHKNRKHIILNKDDRKFLREIPSQMLVLKKEVKDLCGS